MKHTTTIDHVESFCVLLFAVAVFVWKPGIYVSCGLISLYLMVRAAMQTEFRRALQQSRLVKFSLGLYLIGLITATLGADSYQDVAWMARKTLFLPAVVFFCFAFKRPINQRLALTGLIASFWVASVVTLWSYGWQFQFGQRMEGTWPLGTWDSLQGLFFPFMVLYMSRQKLTPISWLIYGATTAMALLMLLLAGGRAPWLGALVGLAAYVLLFKHHRQLLIGLAMTSLIGIIVSVTFLSDKVAPVVERFATVTDTTNNESNWIRLRLWEIGLHHLTRISKDDPLSLAFGKGALSYDEKQIAYFKTMPFDSNDRQRLEAYGYPTGDTHNTYIDNSLRHGVIWTALMTLYLVWLCTRLSWAYVRQNPEPSILLIGLSIVGMFYTMVPHFATFFFVLFVTLLATRPSDRVERSV